MPSCSSYVKFATNVDQIHSVGQIWSILPPAASTSWLGELNVLTAEQGPPIGPKLNKIGQIVVF